MFLICIHDELWTVMFDTYSDGVLLSIIDIDTDRDSVSFTFLKIFLAVC